MVFLCKCVNCSSFDDLGAFCPKFFVVNLASAIVYHLIHNINVIMLFKAVIIMLMSEISQHDFKADSYAPNTTLPKIVESITKDFKSVIDTSEVREMVSLPDEQLILGLAMKVWKPDAIKPDDLLFIMDKFVPCQFDSLSYLQPQKTTTRGKKIPQDHKRRGYIQKGYGAEPAKRLRNLEGDD